MITAPALRLLGLRARHPGMPELLRGVDLGLAPGEKVALLGLNGSGKSTLLKAIVGLIPHEGEIQILGITATQSNIASMRRRLGFLFNQPEDQLLFPSVMEDVEFGPRQAGLGRERASARAIEAMRKLGIEDLALMETTKLSQGQKQKVALAGIMALEPPLLLLDEPSASMDPPGKRALANTLASLAAAMLIATHDLAFARLCCDSAVLLRNGVLEPWPLNAEL